MFEVIFHCGDGRPKTRTCDVGNLLPTIATILQDFERDHGKYEHQQNYAIQWRRVKE